MKKLVLIISLLMILYPTYVYSWDGYDYDTENYIEFDQDGPVVQGKDFDIYDYSDESHHTVYVISIDKIGNELVIEGYDYDEGEYRTFYMDEDTDDQKKNIDSV